MKGGCGLESVTDKWKGEGCKITFLLQIKNNTFERRKKEWVIQV